MIMMLSSNLFHCLFPKYFKNVYDLWWLHSVCNNEAKMYFKTFVNKH